MNAAIYLLCAFAALLCTVLLAFGARRTGSRMLAWSALCFTLLTAANVLLVVDDLALPGAALWPVRHGLSLLAVGSLVYGLIMEKR